MLSPWLFNDWTMLLFIPGLILAVWAQARVKSTFAKFSKVYSQRGIQSQEIASKMLRSYNLFDVSVQKVSGQLTDHYDPKGKTLNLSQSVYGSASIASIGVAAHEAGHAIQHATEYRPLVLRSLMFPLVKIGSSLSWPIFLFGILFSYQPLMKIGILVFSITVLFTLITLPVEFNASSHALKILKADGYLSNEELSGAKQVLNAAALTYVASAVNALLQLLRLVLLSRRSR